MIYNNDISILGLGCMRLPKDTEESGRLVAHALDLGINYFDTAYIYSGNEAMLGRIMKKYDCRGRMKIATKIPHYLLNSPGDIERYFQIQLERLGTDHIDYYLMHMLPDVMTWHRLCDIGVSEWLDEKKRSGQILHAGFSYHGGTQEFIKLIDEYDWDFTQVQYNYVDAVSQAGRAGVEHAHEKGVPVFIMEPLRGGLLTDKLPAPVRKLIDEGTPRHTPAEWGLRWLYDQPAVTMVLSGMNTMAMLDENAAIASASPAGCLSSEERAFYDKITDAMNKSMKVGCTGCSYCMPCPYGVNIPSCFRAYNSSYSDGYFRAVREYFMVLAFSGSPSFAGLCRKCGRCAKHCPQQIPIPEMLTRVKHRLEFPGFGAVRWFYRHFMLKSGGGK